MQAVAVFTSNMGKYSICRLFLATKGTIRARQNEDMWHRNKRVDGR